MSAHQPVLSRLVADYRLPFSAALLVNLLAYGYVFFTYIYTNHTFPNIYSFGFPSYRTVLEGRWGADLIYLLQGGKGIPLLDLLLAVPMQIVNGLLLARLLNARSPFALFTGAALVSIHPFVADYYGFGGDHLVLVLGDTFILSAFVIVQQGFTARFAVPLAACLIQLGLACYQPKISLLATLLVLIVLSRIGTWDGSSVRLRQSLREILLHSLSLLLGVVLYFALFKLSQWWFDQAATASAHSVNRLHTNSLMDMLALLPKVFAHFSQRLFAETTLLTSPWQALLPGILLMAFTLLTTGRICLHNARLNDKALVIAALLVTLCLLPIALYASFIVSAKSYWGSGRFFVPFAYLTAFLGIVLLETSSRRRLRQLVMLAVLFFCYRFTLVNADLGHLAHLRTTQELHFVNRLVTRIEAVITPAAAAPYPVVIIGEPPLPGFLLPPQVIGSNLNQRGFIDYRQVELLNFLLGTNRLGRPASEQVQRALEYAARQESWPGAGSVTVYDGMVVVVLEPVRPGVRTTLSTR